MVRLSVLNDAVLRGKKDVIIRPSSNLVLSFLGVMQRRGFIEKFERHGGHTPGHISVTITDKLKKAVILSQRFDTNVKGIDRWARQILPAPELGYVVMSTSEGVMDHYEAKTKNIGGRVVGYFV